MRSYKARELTTERFAKVKELQKLISSNGYVPFRTFYYLTDLIEEVEHLRDSELSIAFTVMDELDAGISFEELLQSNPAVRVWYDQMKEKRARVEIVRQQLAEKKRLETESYAAVVAKLTPEELAAFGLNKKGEKK